MYQSIRKQININIKMNIMERNYELTGISVSKIWKTSGCSNHESIKAQIDEGKVVAIVRPDKLKLFGKDDEGITRCISWPLGSVEPEAEASLILQKNFNVALPPAQQKIIVFNQPDIEDKHQRVLA